MTKHIIDIEEDIKNARDHLDTIIAVAEREGRELCDSEVETVQHTTEELLPSLMKQRKAAEADRNAFMAKASQTLTKQIDDHMIREGISIPRASKVHNTCFESERDAFNCGQWVKGYLLGDSRAKAYSDRVFGSMTSNTNSAGGFLLPMPLADSVIELRQQYSVARQNCQVVNMSSGTLEIPKMASEVTAYYVGEAAEITASDMSLGLVRLEAKKLATLTKISSELDDDAAVSVADMLARSIAQQFAVAEDSAVFKGDGTSTYGGVVGLENALAAGSVITCTSDQTFADLEFADFENAVATCKRWGGSMPKWYISRAGWAASMQRLLNAAGGNDIISLANGPTMMFMGHPVVITEVLESRLTGTTGLPFAYFGDLRQAGFFGSRREISIVADSSRYLEYDMIAIRAVERYDWVCHDVGDASNAGGIVKMVFG